MGFLAPEDNVGVHGNQMVNSLFLPVEVMVRVRVKGKKEGGDQ